MNEPTLTVPVPESHMQTPTPAHDIEILVVEDSATQALYLAKLLEIDGGYRVRIAVNGREGLLAARAAKPTLIVSDIAMPEMDGFTMCREIKQDAALRDIPVILLTSLTSLYDVIKGLDCGADNFIRKPFDSTYLLGRIRVILASRVAWPPRSSCCSTWCSSWRSHRRRRTCTTSSATAMSVRACWPT